MPNEPGSKARVLIDNAENMNTLPKAWFPDGKSVLLYIQKTDKSWQLARVQVSDGAVKVLKPLQWRLVGVDKDRPEHLARRPVRRVLRASGESEQGSTRGFRFERPAPLCPGGRWIE